MNAARRTWSFRPSRTRLAIWGICLIVVAVLAFQKSDFTIPWQRSATDQTAESGGDPGAAGGGELHPSGPPAVRFGVLCRTAHLVALSGLEMNLYAVAVRDAIEDGWIETVVFDRSSGLARALLEGGIDVATLPIRDAVALHVEHGAAAPRIVAGAALGDERYVLPEGVDRPAFANLAPVRVGMLEAPSMELRATLRLGSPDQPTVVLTAAGALPRSLVSREVDLAVLPEPLASEAAVLSGSQVIDPGEIEGGRLAAGAVLVVAAPFLEEQRDLVGLLVRAHELSAYVVNTQADLSVGRAIVLLARARQVAPPEAVWLKSLEAVRFDTGIPQEELERVLEVARAAGHPGATLDGLVVPEFLEAARSDREEGTGEESGE